jgi:hypothetical protein
MDRVSPDQARAAVANLEGQARDLGQPGRDAVYGQGLVGASIRVAPAGVGARGQLSR